MIFCRLALSAHLVLFFIRRFLIYRSPVEGEIVGLGRGAAMLENTCIFSEYWFVAQIHAESARAYPGVVDAECFSIWEFLLYLSLPPFFFFLILRIFQQIYNRGNVAV